MTKILLVEDDESIALGLSMNLKLEGYEVYLEEDGERGYERALEIEPDLLLLDLMLPKQNGFEVVRRLREAKNNVPIILLTARSAESDKVMGLNLGAEDYVTKPFGLAELLARINAVLRRTERQRPDSPAEPRKMIFGELTVDEGAREVYRGSQLVLLTATEFDILSCLIRADGQVLSRAEIQEQVWGKNHHGTQRTIDNFLLQLRSKLEADPTSPRHLLTVRGVGYRFVR